MSFFILPYCFRRFSALFQEIKYTNAFWIDNTTHSRIWSSLTTLPIISFTLGEEIHVLKPCMSNCKDRSNMESFTFSVLIYTYTGDIPVYMYIQIFSQISYLWISLHRLLLVSEQNLGLSWHYSHYVEMELHWQIHANVM